MEISEEVWVCQSAKPRELKIPSTDSEEEKMPAVVSLCCVATLTIFLTPSARSSGVSAAVCREMPAGVGLCGAGALARVRHRQQIGIRMLNFRQALRRLHHALQALVVEFVGCCSRGATGKYGSHRDRIIFLGDVLMNDVVGKARESALPAIEENFHFVGGGMLPDSLEDVGGLVLV